ncbi:hypothetical protein TrRE_jg5574, partial [Triparma retinervis]
MNPFDTLAGAGSSDVDSTGNPLPFAAPLQPPSAKPTLSPPGTFPPAALSLESNPSHAVRKTGRKVKPSSRLKELGVGGMRDFLAAERANPRQGGTGNGMGGGQQHGGTNKGRGGRAVGGKDTAGRGGEKNKNYKKMKKSPAATQDAPHISSHNSTNTGSLGNLTVPFPAGNSGAPTSPTPPKNSSNLPPAFSSNHRPPPTSQLRQDANTTARVLPQPHLSSSMGQLYHTPPPTETLTRIVLTLLQLYSPSGGLTA